MKMVSEAQGQQSPTQQFTDRFTARFVPIVLVLVVLVAVIPPIVGWMPFPKVFIEPCFFWSRLHPVLWLSVHQPQC